MADSTSLSSRRQLPACTLPACTALAAVAGFAVLAALAPQAAHAATPFDTPGPFVQYSFTGSGRTATTVFGTGWMQASGATATAQLDVQGQGGIGVARIGLASQGGTTNAFAWAGWNDSITVSPADPSLIGRAGTLDFDLRYSWSARVEGVSSTSAAFVDVNLISPVRGDNAYASVTEDVFHSCTRAGSCGAMSVYAQGAPTPSFADGVAHLRLHIVFGRTYTLVVGMNAGLAGSGTLAVDATHSLHWGGVTGVSTSSGAPVASYQLLAGSGMNYLQPVPEAPSAVLCAAGLGLLAQRLRRRARRAAA